MRRNRTCFFSIALFIGSVICFGQTPKIDSLTKVVESTETDTTKVQALNNLFLEYEFSDEEKAEQSLAQALSISKKMGYKMGIALTYTHLGYFSEDKGNYNEALKNYRSALEMQLMINDKKGLAGSYNNIGNVFYFQANYPEAIANYFKSLKIRELLKDQEGIANAYSNLGLVYFNQESYAAALKNYSICLKIYNKIGDKKGIAIAADHIGLVYYYQNDYEKALESYHTSLKLFEEIGDKRRIAGAYNNMGGVYANKEDYPETLRNYFIALNLRDKNDLRGIADSYGNIGIALMKQKKYGEARHYLNDSKALLKKIGARENLKKAYKALTFLDSATGNFKGAYENNKMFISYSDSLDNEVTRKKTIQSQMNYDFEKKEAVAEAEHKKELENQEVLAEEKSRKQTIVLSLVLGSLLLVVVFAGFIFRSLRITRKQKDVIEQQKGIVELQKQEVEMQKDIVEAKQKEIIDSITYARRIQKSLLPSEKYIDTNLKRLKK